MPAPAPQTEQNFVTLLCQIIRAWSTCSFAGSEHHWDQMLGSKIPALCRCHFYISGRKAAQQSAPDAKLKALDIFVTSRDTQGKGCRHSQSSQSNYFLSSRQEQIQAVCFCVSIGTFIQTSLKVGWCFSTGQWTLDQVPLKSLSKWVTFYKILSFPWIWDHGPDKALAKGWLPMGC